jgi:hypothetical protein
MPGASRKPSPSSGKTTWPGAVSHRPELMLNAAAAGDLTLSGTSNHRFCMRAHVIPELRKASISAAMRALSESRAGYVPQT